MVPSPVFLTELWLGLEIMAVRTWQCVLSSAPRVAAQVQRPRESQTWGGSRRRRGPSSVNVAPPEAQLLHLVCSSSVRSTFGTSSTQNAVCELRCTVAGGQGGHCLLEGWRARSWWVRDLGLWAQPCPCRKWREGPGPPVPHRWCENKATPTQGRLKAKCTCEITARP